MGVSNLMNEGKMKDGELFFNKAGRLMRRADSAPDGWKVRFFGVVPAVGSINWATLKPLSPEEKKEITDRLIAENGLIAPDNITY